MSGETGKIAILPGFYEIEYGRDSGVTGAWLYVGLGCLKSMAVSL